MKLVIAEKPSVAMHRNTMKNIKNGDMRICRLCRNVGNTGYWKARKSSLES